MMYTPNRPSQNSPHVEVNLGTIKMKFWVEHSAKTSLLEMLRTLESIPSGQHWRICASEPYPLSVHGRAAGVQAPRGFRFMLLVAPGGSCSLPSFDMLFKTFEREVLQIAAREHVFLG
jgi:hypothetical protein